MSPARKSYELLTAQLHEASASVELAKANLATLDPNNRRDRKTGQKLTRSIEVLEAYCESIRRQMSGHPDKPAEANRLTSDGV
jgi:hypothetical protein